MGKLPNAELKKLLSCIKKDPRVLIPPAVGYDSGVHKIGENYLVVSTDPCTGVPMEWFGWLLINYAASDVALFGARPEFCTINLLGPPKTEAQTFQEIMTQACHAADELDITITTGHTGTYNSVTEPLGICTAYGTIQKDKMITPANSKAGDLILCSKPLGLETLTNLCLTRRAFAQRLFGAKESGRLANLVPEQSCVKAALLLSQTGGTNAMHDATEGGFVSALNEMAETAKLGFRIELSKLPFDTQIWKLQEEVGLTQEQMLSMSSTGTIVAAVDPQAKTKVVAALCRIGVEPSFVGVFTRERKRVLLTAKKEEKFPQEADDPYTKIFSKKA